MRAIIILFLLSSCTLSWAQTEEEEEDEMMRKCLRDNQYYMIDCSTTGLVDAINDLAEEEITDEDILRCTFFRIMANCFVKRMGEKCGEKAAGLARLAMDDPPPDVAHSCEVAGSNVSTV